MIRLIPSTLFAALCAAPIWASPVDDFWGDIVAKPVIVFAGTEYEANPLQTSEFAGWYNDTTTQTAGFSIANTFDTGATAAADIAYHMAYIETHCKHCDVTESTFEGVRTLTFDYREADGYSMSMSFTLPDRILFLSVSAIIWDDTDNPLSDDQTDAVGQAVLDSALNQIIMPIISAAQP